MSEELKNAAKEEAEISTEEIGKVDAASPVAGDQLVPDRPVMIIDAQKQRDKRGKDHGVHHRRLKQRLVDRPALRGVADAPGLAQLRAERRDRQQGGEGERHPKEPGFPQPHPVGGKQIRHARSPPTRFR